MMASSSKTRSYTIAVAILLYMASEVQSENGMDNIMSTLVTDHLLRGSKTQPVITTQDIEEMKKHLQEDPQDANKSSNMSETEIIAENKTDQPVDTVLADDQETTETIEDNLSTTFLMDDPQDYILAGEGGDEAEAEHLNDTDKYIKEEFIETNFNMDSVPDTTQNIDVARNVETKEVVEDQFTTESSKLKDNYDKNEEANRSNSIEVTTKETKMETTTILPSTTTTTTQPITEPQIITSNVAELQDHLENTGNRSPKTDKSEQTTMQEKRTFDMRHASPQLSRSATLKSWLQDSWLRSPPGLLIPLRPAALTRALGVWEDLLKNEELGVTDIVIIGFDSSGVNWRSRHNLHDSSTGNGKHTVSDVLHKLLHKYQDAYTTDVAGDATMRALATASKLVPYDSALFIITDRGAADSQRLPLALKALVEKRLKVYTIWTGPQLPLESNKDLEELRSISAHTEGEVIPYMIEEQKPDLTANAATQTEWQLPIAAQEERSARLNTLFDDKMEILLVKRSGGGSISLGVPVESGVSALRVLIEGAVDHAVLYPPNDAPQINLYNKTSVREFSPSSRTDGLSPRDVYLVFPGAPDGDMLQVLPVKSENAEGVTQNSGTWHLSAKCDSCDYRITVSAHAWIRFEAGLINDETLSLHVNGPVSTVREASLVDEYGAEMRQLPFSYQQTSSLGEHPKEESQIQDIKKEVPYQKSEGTARIYAKITGRDFRGEPYVRLAGPLNPQSEVRVGRAAAAALRFPESRSDLEGAEEYSQRAYDNRWGFNESTVLPNNRATSQIVNQRGSLLTAVQIGLGTRLYGSPGDSMQLHFEVTNYREQSVSFRFEAVGELRFLRGISPASQVIASGQTANVIVQVGITATAQPGARDLITFTAYGLEQVSVSAYVYVLNPDMTITDVWAPSLTNNFQGSCIGKTGDDCAEHIWSSRIIAQDAVAGLLRLSSIPIGLTYDSNFVAGTREQVLASYRATCCAPRVVVTAVDAMGNANSYVLDISSYVTPAGVAAIVLGVFLAIALIILVIFLVYWLVRRRRESKELSYTASSRRDVS